MKAQLVSNELNDLLKKLDNSPLHHLSLASLETFHSNCWAWLIQKVDPSAVAIFDSTVKSFKKPIVQREKTIGNRKQKDSRRLDLWIEIEDASKMKTQYIIENKLKSVITFKQLNDIVRHSPDCKNFILLSLFDSISELPPPWKRLTFSQLAKGLEILTATVADERNRYFCKEYQSLIQILSEIAEILKRDYITESLDFSSKAENTLAHRLSEVKLFSIYEKFRMGDLSKYLHNALESYFQSKGYEPTFGSEERTGSIFFEYGYSTNTYRAFAEFIVPICDGRARIGAQITHDRFAYFLDTRNKETCDDAANALDQTGLWFANRKRLNKNKGFCTFDKTFRYEYIKLDKGCPYSDIVPMLKTALETALQNKEQIEAVVAQHLQ